MFFLLIGDCLISVVVFVLGTYFFSLGPCEPIGIKGHEGAIGVFAIATLFPSFLLDLYSSKSHIRKALFLLKSLAAAAIAFLLLTVAYKFIPCVVVPGRPAGYALLLFVFFQTIWHMVYFSIIKMPLFAKNILVLGTGAKAVKIDNLLEVNPSRYRLKGYVDTFSESVLVPQEKVIGDIDTIVEDALKHRIDTIVIALGERRGNLPIDKLLTCKLHGMNIADLPTFYELLTGKLPVEDINPSWLVYSQGFRVTTSIKAMKRLSDILFASLLLLLSLPFLPLIALLIKTRSPGPVFYTQTRVGEEEKEFTMYKFRTMQENAEKATGVAWAQENDPRITRIGTFLRKTRLDELPQLINVLKGDMSFIGPRPERPEFVRKIKEVTPYYGERHCVKPGLTGWAQVRYPYGASFGDAVEKLRYDLFYINNMSFLLDLLIVFETMKVVAFRRYGR